MKKITIFLVLIVLFSCKEKGSNSEEKPFFVFYPRECNFIWASWAKFKDVSDSKISNFEILGVPENELSAKEALLVVYSSNLDTLVNKNEKSSFLLYPYAQQNQMVNLDKKLAPHDINLEAQLETDYNNPVSKLKSKKTEEAFPVNLDYRVTGVKNLIITSTNTLFGKVAGTPLNDFFIIKRLDPKQVISSKSKRLLMGYSDKDSVVTIADWLNMEPMAQPTMFLAFKNISIELPVATSFVVTIETNAGKIIRDTTSTLSIIP